MRPRQYTDEALLDAARACFLEHGPGVSTKLVADTLGVSQATLFKRFGTKNDLLKAALRPQPPEFILRLPGGPAPGDVRPQLVAFCGEMLAFFERMIPCIATLQAAGLKEEVLQETSIGGDSPPIAIRKMLAAWLRAAQADGRMGDFDADVVAIALLGALHTVPMRRHMLGDELPDPTQYIDRLIEALWAGIGPAEASP